MYLFDLHALQSHATDIISPLCLWSLFSMKVSQVYDC